MICFDICLCIFDHVERALFLGQRKGTGSDGSTRDRFVRQWV